MSSRTINVKVGWDGPFNATSTFDVLAIVGEEDDAHLEVVASFKSLADARAFKNADVVTIRPPHAVTDVAHEWTQFVYNVVNAGIEYERAPYGTFTS